MSATALIQRCRSEGVRLWLAGDKLEVEGEFDDSLVDELRAAKPAIVAALRCDAEKIRLDDREQYLAHLREIGPTTYGAAATALGWGATRAWQAEARLRADGHVRIGKDGRAHLSK